MMMTFNTKKLKVFPFFLLLIILFNCSKSEVNDEEVIEIPEEEIPETPTIDPNKIVSINASAVVGNMYNFWSTRPMINQTRFNSSNFTNSLDGIKSYVKSYNLVRVLGGRNDNLNDFYKGVDNSGNIITDFSGLLQSMRNFMQTGFKPRIVLDNVPWEMSGEKVVDTYGNSKPAADYNLWRQYINAFLQTLVNEFGMNEVKTWRFRVATEPNYSPNHWRGTRDDYFKHYDITVDEVLKVIPDAIIGPGNLLTEDAAAKWTTEIIDHCANGTNFATGEKGTQMDFFSLSYYEKIDKNEVRFAEVVEPYRAKLNSYPQFKNIPFDIQEFGILRDENGNRGLSLYDVTELGASWYATIADIAYQNNVTEIYDWGQETEGLPSGRRLVTEMFEMIKDGTRLQSINNFNDFSGAIPVEKNGNIYLLVYNHNTSRTSNASKTIYPQIEGGQISGNTNWKMNAWTIDKTHGIFAHEFYKDCLENGVAKKANGRIYGSKTSDYFEDGYKTVFENNKAKYESLSKLPQTIKDSIIQKVDDKVTLKIDLAPHSVKLIELIPQ